METLHKSYERNKTNESTGNIFIYGLFLQKQVKCGYFSEIIKKCTSGPSLYRAQEILCSSGEDF